MEIGVILKNLQDPMGIPFYPIVFQILMVLTFALHIMFVNFTLGSSFLSLYGYLKGGDHWRRLSKSLAKATTINSAMAIVLGVAPLLFVQVIYDPFWYTSNTLSAAWVIGFIFIMMLAYSFAYVFYLKGRSTGGNLAIFGILSFAFFVLAGVIIHVLNYQLLLPEKWLQWYIKGNSVDASGTSLHAFQLSRFLHFIIPSFAMTGILLMLYAWYFKEREDFDKSYLDWVGKIGAKIALIFTAIQALVGFWWLFSLPSELNFFTNPFFLVGAGLGIILLVLLFYAQKDPVKYAIPSILAGFLAIFGMSYAREALRMSYLSRFNYSIFDYKLSIDWGSTFLFLLTFVMGLVIIGYQVYVAYSSGRVKGEYVALPSIHKWGKVSIALLVAWLIVVVTLGVIITVRNYF